MTGDIMITLSKLAKLANVSVSTASKAFTGSNEVNAETREMIFNVAREHNCFKKFYNVKYPKLVIAIIAPEFSSAYYAQHLSFIQKYLDALNCELCVSVSNFSCASERALLEYYYKHSNVDGVIIINGTSVIEENYEIPVVCIAPKLDQPNAVSLKTRHLPALSQAVDYLLERGVDSIGFIGEQLTTSKLENFRAVLAEKGIHINEDFISISDMRFEAGGYAAMDKLFEKGELPRSIICAYDHMAIGAIRCIYDHGLKVPEDIAVLGMDDIPEAGYLNPPLASVSTHTEELCRLATEAVIKKINGEELAEPEIMASFNLRRSFEIS